MYVVRGVRQVLVLDRFPIDKLGAKGAGGGEGGAAGSTGRLLELVMSEIEKFSGTVLLLVTSQRDLRHCIHNIQPEVRHFFCLFLRRLTSLRIRLADVLSVFLFLLRIVNHFTVHSPHAFHPGVWLAVRGREEGSVEASDASRASPDLRRQVQSSGQGISQLHRRRHQRMHLPSSL